MRNPAARIIAVVALLLAACVWAEDWPTYQHDMARSGVSGEQLSLPLNQHWLHKPASPPEAAWADPQPVPVEGVLEPPKVKFDDAFYTTAAAGLVFYGSSSGNYVCALDAMTGQVRWRVVVDGPVRLAPVYDQGRLYFGSDDGYLYCVNATDGKPLWQRLIGPTPARRHRRRLWTWSRKGRTVRRSGCRRWPRRCRRATRR